MTEADIYTLLANRFTAEAGWAILRHVRSQTGYAGAGRSDPRTADAIAMQLYPSRGCTLHGFEIKVSRADWRKELQQAAKADAIARYCHQWSIVAPKGIVPLEELPPAWGLIEVIPRGDGKLHTRKAAPMREPEPIPYEFLASIFRNISTANAKVHKDQIDAAFRQGREIADSLAAHDKAAHEQLQDSVRAFEQASGVSILKWGEDQQERNRGLGYAVRAVLDGDQQIRRYQTRLGAIHRQVRDLLDSLENELGQLEEAAA